MMNLNQTKLVGLTMELNLKTIEYKKLCDKLEQIKQSGINPNDEKLLKFKQLFQKNHDEIVEINKKIKELKETQDFIEKQKLEKYNTENLFKRENRNTCVSKEENITVIETEKNIFQKFIKKIKEFFRRNK